MVQALERYLGRVKEITGTLKIQRSFPIMSLDFFKSLEKIEGIQTEDTANGTRTLYSLEISENENLQKLFPIGPDGKTVQIEMRRHSKAAKEKGKAFLHYNPNLCSSEIKRMINASNLVDPGPSSKDISYATNGDKAVCSQNKLNLTIKVNYPTEMMVEFNSYQETIQKVYKSDHRNLLKYEIHYRKITKEMYDNRNDTSKRLSKYRGRDACGGDEWEITDHTPSEPQLINGTSTWLGESAFVATEPFTYYAVFVKTMITRDSNSNVEGAESDIGYVLTMEGTPTPPQDVKVDHLNFTCVNVTWLPPEHPNGIIDYYEVIWEPIEINVKRIMLRPFCNESYKIKDDRDELVKIDNMPKNTTKIAPDGQCDCTQCGPEFFDPKRTKETSVARLEKIEEDQFLDEILNVIFQSSEPMINRKKRAINDQEERRNTVSTSTAKPPLPVTRRNSRRVKPHLNHLVITENLRHFSMYNLIIKACLRSTIKVFEKTLTPCSNTQLEFRTLPKPGADNIPGDLRIVGQENGNNETSNVFITWDPPTDPNLLIAYYNIKITTRKDIPDPGSTTCITAKAFLDHDQKYQPMKFGSGSYYVKVQAVSLSGAGAWTTYKFVSVSDGNTHLLLVVMLPICVIFLVVIIAGVVIFRFYGRHDRLIPNEVYQKTVTRLIFLGFSKFVLQKRRFCSWSVTRWTNGNAIEIEWKS